MVLDCNFDHYKYNEERSSATPTNPLIKKRYPAGQLLGGR